MATKHTSRCLAKAADDEPIFVLRAQDLTAPEVVRAWVRRAAKLGAPTEKLNAALACATDMERWARESGKRKVPD